MELTSFTFVVDSPPRAKQRPRLGRRRKAFTPEATLIAEDIIAQAYVAAGGPLFEGPVTLTVVYSSKHQTITIQNNEQPSKMRGDVDNYLKTTLDALNGLAYADDRQVTILCGNKT